MKVTPNLYNVVIEANTEWDPTESSFIEGQKPYHVLDFVELSVFDPEGKYSQCLLKESKLVLSDEQLLQLAVLNIKFQVKQKINVSIDITKQLIELAEKPIKIITEGGGANVYNNKCEVHMPGHSLSLYNEMLLLEDACTDELQTSLNSGYRIVAACPQPDKRRPDYILGRFNPTLEICGAAERTPSSVET